MSTTRERLLAAAALLIDEGGPAAVTLREVGARAGVSHNAPYRHFTDKRDLLAAVAAADLHELATRIATSEPAQGEGRELLMAAAMAYITWARERPARFQLAFGPWDAPHDALGEAAAAATAALENCVQAAYRRGGLVGEPDRAAALVWALGHGAVDLELAGHLQKKPSSPTADALVQDLVDLLGERPA